MRVALNSCTEKHFDSYPEPKPPESGDHLVAGSISGTLFQSTRTFKPSDEPLLPAPTVAECNRTRYISRMAETLLDGRYRKIHELGRGGMGVVWLVEDRARKNRRLAIKILDRQEFTSSTLRHFEQEFRIQSELRHPHLVEVHDFGRLSSGDESASRPYFTMDYVEGVPLDVFLRQGELTIDDWAPLLSQLGHGLAYLHARGFVHRDLKPSNILVGLTDNGPHVTLMDLGLAERWKDQHQEDDTSIRGTVAYLAPEAIRCDPLDARADLYSLGCMLYELATGRPPFLAESVAELLRAHLEETPLSPSMRNRTIPQAWDARILELLAKTPGERPATLEAWFERLRESISGDWLVDTPEVQRHRVLGGVFLGRESLLGNWQQLCHELRAGRGGLLWLEGEQGIGKSRLLREFQLRAQLDGLACPIGSADAPTGALREVLSTLFAHDDEDRLLPEQLWLQGETGRARDMPHILAQLESRLEARAKETPFAFAIDDIQELDERDSRVLESLLTNAAEKDLPILFVATADRSKSAGRGSGSLRERLSTRRSIMHEIEPLSAGEVRALVETRCGTRDLPEEFLQRMVEESGGNPTHLEALLIWLVEEGRLKPGSPTPWQSADEEPWELPRRARDLIDHRLDMLPAETASVWLAAAVWDQRRLDPDALSAIAEVGAEQIVARLIELQQADYLTIDADPRGDPIYRVRQSGLLRRAAERSSAADRSAMNARAGRYLERRTPAAAGTWRRLARHADHALMPGRAIDAWGRAGDQALAGGSPEEARICFSEGIERALRQPSTSVETLCDLYRGRSKAHARLGKRQRAEEDARWWLARTTRDKRPVLAAEARFTLAERLRDLGDTREELSLLKSVEDDAEAPQKLRDHARLSRLRRENADEELLACLRKLHDRPLDEIEIELRQRVAYLGAELLTRQGNADAAESWLADARASGPPRSIENLEIEIAAGWRSGDADGVLRKLEDARLAARVEGDLQKTASLENQLALRGLQAGSTRWSDRLLATAGENSESEPLRHLRDRLAGHWEKLDLQQTAGGPLESIQTALTLGNTEEAIRRLREWTAPDGAADSTAVDRKLLTALTARMDGRIEEALRDAQEAAFLARRTGDRPRGFEAAQLLGELNLDRGDLDRAAAARRRAERLLAEMPAPSSVHRADALRLIARLELERPGGDIVSAQQAAAEALERASAAGRFDESIDAMRLLALVERRLQQEEEAGDRMADACRRLRQHLKELTPSQREAALRVPARRNLQATWDQWRRGSGGSVSAEPAADQAQRGELAAARAHIEDLTSLLEINRSLNLAPDLDSLTDRILAAARRTSGAERAFLWITDNDNEVYARGCGNDGQPLVGEDLAFPRSVTRRVVESGEALVSQQAESDERLESFQTLHQLRVVSLICVPIHADSKTQGALYMDSRIGGRPVHENSLQLAEALAVQAGIAIRRARMIEELGEQRTRSERLNRDLQKAVQEQGNELADAREALTFSRTSIELRARFEEMIGASAAMQRVYHLIERLAPKKLPVMIQGESGTGKELIARALHTRGANPAGPFFTINCAAIHESLLESELFGHRKGAFTGADRNKPGYFELAHGGTLFLDEVGEMGPAMQAKLLRVIENGEVFAVGAQASKQIDVRIVTATHRDLKSMIAEGSFREDLFYRFHVGSITIPPLRERREDIPLLVDHFLKVQAEEEGVDPHTVEPDALRLLASQQWPGNVRELQHQLLRVTAFLREGPLTARALHRYGDLPAAGTTDLSSVSAISPGDPFPTLETMETQHLRAALERADGNRTRAAELLGINRATLFRRLKKLDLDTS